MIHKFSYSQFNFYVFMRIFLVLFLVIGLFSCNKSEDETIVSSNDSIAMGAQYTNDIYYSFSNGIVGTQPRNNWDIAFKTSPRSSSILINSPMGVKLWQYNSDTTKWATAFDTTGIKNKVNLIDSDTTWSLSAFEANQTGHPDYGWGEYNSINHDVIGTGLFIIQLPDKSFKKIWIKKRVAASNTYVFTYADLNGANAVTKNVVTGNYLAKNYVYFKFGNGGEIVDREPAQDAWDIVLTKYYEMVYNNTTQKYEPYNVTGFLQNEGVTVAEVNGDLASNNYSGEDFETSISTIGSDWKTLDMQTFSYTIKPDVKYFVQTRSKNIYKLVFEKFEGSSTGKVVFEKTKLK